MDIILQNSRFSIRSHDVAWGYGRSRTILYVKSLNGSDDALAEFLTLHQDQLGISCVPGNVPGQDFPAMMVVSRESWPLEELPVKLVRELDQLR